MKKFYYFLSEQPNYPNAIMAKNKAEVKSLLMESLADESSIVNILSEDELNKKNNSNIRAIYSDPTEYANGNDFMNDVIKSATIVAQNNSKQCSSQEEDEEVKTECNIERLNNLENSKISCDSPNSSSKVKLFEEAGIKFKLENGKLYKKVWKDLTTSEISEFRIINVKTNKPVDLSKYRIEQLDWEEI